MILNIKFHKILFISSRATLTIKFLSNAHRRIDSHTHRQKDRETHRHFSKIVKSYSGHQKTCKSSKNRKSNIFTKTIFFSIYAEESKNNSATFGQLLFAFIKNCPQLSSIFFRGNTQRIVHMYSLFLLLRNRGNACTSDPQQRK